MTSAERLADGVRQRARALERFAEWEATHLTARLPDAAIEAVGAVCELLPPSARRRPVDPTGVMALHRTLGRLSR
jgi:hypothetical protein